MMRQANNIIDESPSYGVISTIVEADILNKLADDELKYFEHHQSFLNKHPLLVERKENETLMSEIKDIVSSQNSLVKFISNAQQNITRITRRIEKNSPDDIELEKLKKRRALLEKKLKMLADYVKK